MLPTIQGKFALWLNKKGFMFTKKANYTAELRTTQQAFSTRQTDVTESPQLHINKKQNLTISLIIVNYR